MENYGLGVKIRLPTVGSASRGLGATFRVQYDFPDNAITLKVAGSPGSVAQIG
jgi:hypothetical protein